MIELLVEVWLIGGNAMGVRFLSKPCLTSELGILSFE